MKLQLWPHRRSNTGDLATILDRMFETPYTNRLPEVFQTGMAPAVNIAESEASFTVSVELPGLNEADIDVQVLGNQLVIAAERRFDEDKKGKEFHRVEHLYGSFSRSITLPTGLRTDTVDARYKKGILTLTIAKVEPTPAAKVKVKVED
jgi:HSP20 family protein